MPRITSYNVCYTKLLRVAANLIANACRALEIDLTSHAQSAQVGGVQRGGDQVETDEVAVKGSYNFV